MIHNIGPKKNFQTVPIPQGVKELSSLIYFLADKKSFESHLDELLDLTKEANTAIELVGKSEDIIKLLVQAEAKDEAATKVLEEQKDKAKSLITSTQAQADTIIEKAKAQTQEAQGLLDKLIDQANKRDQETEAALKSAKVTIEKAEAKEAEINALQAAMSKRDLDLTTKENEVARKLKVISDL